MLNRLAGQILSVLSDDKGNGRVITSANDLDITDPEFLFTADELEAALMALKDRDVICIDDS